ncbi:enterochelin esterase [Nocardiopsis algeriensis]|uniref:Enterochelin esterase family protein n=1 Tax=Nocardiopsis algeriensis TaxID=1478215 RepID=A0A841IHV8_9ACTN|nr:enterochelin esterase family protein [Nocardiopsis algeriensis]
MTSAGKDRSTMERQDIPLHTIPPRLKRTARPERVPTPCVQEAARDPEGFWRRVAGSGTPMVGEADAEGRRTVTFLWRGGDELADVVLAADKAAAADSYRSNRMERVPGTDVWHLTYRMHGDWRASYTVAPVPAGGGPVSPDALPEVLRIRRERALAVSEPEDRPALARWFDALAHAVPDPLARERLDARTSVVSLPEAPRSLWREGTEAPAGRVTGTQVASEHLGNTRTVTVHEPARRPPEGLPWPVVVLLDGQDWRSLPPLIDALVADGTLPPALTVLVDSLGPIARTRELACSDAFVSFLGEELLPLLARRYPVTGDPSRTAVAGQSLGGLTALYAAHRNPGRFGRVVSQSGSFWWPGVAAAGGESERMPRLLAGAGEVPERVHLSAGTDEWSLLGPNRRLHAALAERGAALGRAPGFAVLEEYRGGHDRACWHAGLPAALAFATADWER